MITPNYHMSVNISIRIMFEELSEGKVSETVFLKLQLRIKCSSIDTPIILFDELY